MGLIPVFRLKWSNAWQWTWGLGDDQATDECTVSICVKDASGPYHYEFRQHLVALAKDQEIPYKLDIYPFLWIRMPLQP